MQKRQNRPKSLEKYHSRFLSRDAEFTCRYSTRRVLDGRDDEPQRKGLARPIGIQRGFVIVPESAGNAHSWYRRPKNKSSE